MDVDLYREMENALRRAESERLALHRELAGLKARLEQLVEVLIGRGTLVEGHRRLLEKVGERAGAAESDVRKVRLRQWVDKYQVPSVDID